MEERIQELIDHIEKADHAYYNRDNPIVSDMIYDAWRDELSDLVTKCTNKKLKKKAEKTLAKVGAEVKITEWKKVTHDIPMGSLNKVNTPDELRKWVKDCSAEKEKLLVCDKLDGISLNCAWKDGLLIQASTRGSGIIGENITPNVRKMKGIPTIIPVGRMNKVGYFSGNLRGEIILKKSDHKQHFPTYSNPRNAASGIAKRFDGVGNEHLTVIFYQVLGIDFETELEQFEYLKSLGVELPFYHACKNVDEVVTIWSSYQDEVRETLDWEIDGLVVRVNNFSLQLALGELNHRPKGAVAFKFEAAARETILRKIIWQTGSTGRITPVAEFDEVELVGAKVNRASLYNHSYIEELGLDIGAKIIVCRANDVVPRCEEVIKPTGTIAKPPTQCPECFAPTSFTGEYLMCTGSNCPAKRLGRLQTWINCHNILDWSEATLQRVLDAALVMDVADLYRLTPQELIPLERMGEKLANKLVDILDQHREVPLENFIGGLGIDGISTSMVKLATSAGYDTLDKLQKMSINDLIAIDGFGDIKAKAFYDGLKANENRIQAIFAAGVKIKDKVRGTLSNSSFCFTGSSNLPRAKLHELVEENGGEIKKNVTKGLTYLVMADPASTSNKTQAAKKFGTKIISEDEFMKMIGK